jgi:hypothetical protein
MRGLQESFFFRLSTVCGTGARHGFRRSPEARRYRARGHIARTPRHRSGWASERRRGVARLRRTVLDGGEHAVKLRPGDCGPDAGQGRDRFAAGDASVPAQDEFMTLDELRRNAICSSGCSRRSAGAPTSSCSTSGALLYDKPGSYIKVLLIAGISGFPAHHPAAIISIAGSGAPAAHDPDSSFRWRPG